ncbi:hypothetical protein QYM36_016872 [Artemia franciscana]|uniref:Ribokinase n=1 Tax=Artemia franciscana TaxID=6661 RepID=A0AA88KWC3_ARTSF|nr:hypothetical protein QYM36_016872 [Artemia franciscana]KAK2704624.1 hypothetical protein QYM36_016872 [Artemia franciscana]
MAVVVVGSLITDIISYVERLPQPGETIRGKSLFIGCGGKGANQCVAAAKLGAECTMIGKLGSDSFSEMHETSFKSLGINFEHVSRTDEAFTGVAQILVEETGQNSIVIVPGANDKLGAENVRKAVALIKEACVVVAQLEVNIEASVEALKLAFTNEVKIIFNAAPAASNLPSEVYQLSSVFCVNESEAEMLTGEKVDSIESADRSAQILQERGCKVVLITLGSRGAYLKDEANNGILIAAPPVKAVDTTILFPEIVERRTLFDAN